MSHIMKMISCSSFPMDSHENMSMLSNIYSKEYTRIETLNVCTEEKNQLHDILNIMTRSMAIKLNNLMFHQFIL